MADFIPTERTQVRRLPKRGTYERDAVYRILDEGLVCHVGFVADGRPVVIPTGYGRKDDTLYVHGSPASRMFRALGKGADLCITVTLVDGLVLARSAFHHSINYRSVVIFGRATMLEDSAAKREALRVFTEHVVPGRWQDIRQPTEKELQATTVLAIPLKKCPPRFAPVHPLMTRKITRSPSGRASFPSSSRPSRRSLTSALRRKSLSRSMCGNTAGKAASVSNLQGPD